MSEPARFFKYELRTTDVSAAGRFYTDLLGRTCDIVQLPEQARARGARPHWLGHLGVADVEASVRAFVERGATQLGPTRPVDGGLLAVVRDLGGAVVGLATPSPAADPGVVWHALNTDDLPRASAAHCELFGWRMTERLELGAHGVFDHFTWNSGGASVGSFAAIAGRPGVHPHWLFHFRVAALEPALAHVRAAGGLVAGTFILPDGERLAVCDDPQGAAFALREPAPKVM